MTTPALNILPIDLLHFLNAVLITGNTEGGFGLDDVERVEEAWEIADAVSHGYIVVQGDGASSAWSASRLAGSADCRG